MAPENGGGWPPSNSKGGERNVESRVNEGTHQARASANSAASFVVEFGSAETPGRSWAARGAGGAGEASGVAAARGVAVAVPVPATTAVAGAPGNLPMNYQQPHRFQAGIGPNFPHQELNQNSQPPMGAEETSAATVTTAGYATFATSAVAAAGGTVAQQGTAALGGAVAQQGTAAWSHAAGQEAADNPHTNSQAQFQAELRDGTHTIQQQNTAWNASNASSAFSAFDVSNEAGASFSASSAPAPMWPTREPSRATATGGASMVSAVGGSLEHRQPVSSFDKVDGFWNEMKQGNNADNQGNGQQRSPSKQSPSKQSPSKTIQRQPMTPIQSTEPTKPAALKKRQAVPNEKQPGNDGSGSALKAKKSIQIHPSVPMTTQRHSGLMQQMQQMPRLPQETKPDKLIKPGKKWHPEFLLRQSVRGTAPPSTPGRQAYSPFMTIEQGERHLQRNDRSDSPIERNEFAASNTMQQHHENHVRQNFAAAAALATPTSQVNPATRPGQQHGYFVRQNAPATAAPVSTPVRHAHTSTRTVQSFEHPDQQNVHPMAPPEIPLPVAPATPTSRVNATGPGQQRVDFAHQSVPATIQWFGHPDQQNVFPMAPPATPSGTNPRSFPMNHRGNQIEPNGLAAAPPVTPTSQMQRNPREVSIQNDTSNVTPRRHAHLVSLPGYNNFPPELTPGREQFYSPTEESETQRQESLGTDVANSANGVENQAQNGMLGSHQLNTQNYAIDANAAGATNNDDEDIMILEILSSDDEVSRLTQSGIQNHPNEGNAALGGNRRPDEANVTNDASIMMPNSATNTSFAAAMAPSTPGNASWTSQPIATPGNASVHNNAFFSNAHPHSAPFVASPQVVFSPHNAVPHFSPQGQVLILQPNGTFAFSNTAAQQRTTMNTQVAASNGIDYSNFDMYGYANAAFGAQPYPMPPMFPVTTDSLGRLCTNDGILILETRQDGTAQPIFPPMMPMHAQPQPPSVASGHPMSPQAHAPWLLQSGAAPGYASALVTPVAATPNAHSMVIPSLSHVPTTHQVQGMWPPASRAIPSNESGHWMHRATERGSAFNQAESPSNARRAHESPRRRSASNKPKKQKTESTSEPSGTGSDPNRTTSCQKGRNQAAVRHEFEENEVHPIHTNMIFVRGHWIFVENAPDPARNTTSATARGANAEARENSNANEANNSNQSSNNGVARNSSSSRVASIPSRGNTNTARSWVNRRGYTLKNPAFRNEKPVCQVVGCRLLASGTDEDGSNVCGFHGAPPGICNVHGCRYQVESNGLCGVHARAYVQMSMQRAPEVGAQEATAGSVAAFQEDGATVASQLSSVPQFQGQWSSARAANQGYAAFPAHGSAQFDSSQSSEASSHRTTSPENETEDNDESSDDDDDDEKKIAAV